MTDVWFTNHEKWGFQPKELPLWTRFRLWFKRPRYSLDYDRGHGTVVEYKVLDGIVYVLDVR